MKKYLPFILIFAVISVMMVGISCKKRKLNRETVTSEDLVLAENMFDDLFKVTHDLASEIKNFEGTHKTRSFSDIYGSNTVITFDPPLNSKSTSRFPRSMNVDFGTSGCDCEDGIKRKGKIQAHFNGRYRDEGTTITITTEDYYINDHLVHGEATITNKGKNGSGNANFDIVIDGTITTSEEQIITWKTNHQWEWIAGEHTGWFFTIDSEGNYDYSSDAWNEMDGILDDKYLITGTTTGVNRDGREFSAEIIAPLQVQFCNWLPEITKGLIELKPRDLKGRTLDYGDGPCDNQVTVNTGKRSEDISLR